ASKTKWFAAAAAIVVIGSGVLLYRPIIEKGQMEAMQQPIVANALARGKDLQQKFATLQARSDVGATATNIVNLFDYRTVWPYLLHDSAAALAAAKPQPELLGANPEAIL